MLLSHELTDEKKVFVSRLARAEVSVVFCSVLCLSLLAALYSILENICFYLLAFFSQINLDFSQKMLSLQTGLVLCNWLSTLLWELKNTSRCLNSLKDFLTFKILTIGFLLCLSSSHYKYFKKYPGKTPSLKQWFCFASYLQHHSPR